MLRQSVLRKRGFCENQDHADARCWLIDNGLVDPRSVNNTGIENADESIKVSAEDPGDNVSGLAGISETGDLEFEGTGPGSVYTTLAGSTIGDDFKFVEEDGGIVDIVIRGSSVADTLEIESDDGDPGTVDAFVTLRGSTIGELDAVDDTVVEEL